MKCPICNEETAGELTQRWGPEFAHQRCVKAYSLGGCDASAAIEAHEARKVPDGWQLISTAPESMDECVVVGWIDDEGSPRTEFDYKEDGCWIKWHEHAENTEVIGGHGVSYTPPYTHWIKLPPLASAPPAPQASEEQWKPISKEPTSIVMDDPVAVVGSCFQLLWARKDWSQGVRVGDLLYPHPAPVREPLTDRVIAGALFDFMGWLTSRKERTVLSSCDDASPAVDAIQGFAKMRGLSLDHPMVKEWSAHGITKA